MFYWIITLLTIVNWILHSYLQDYLIFGTINISGFYSLLLFSLLLPFFIFNILIKKLTYSPILILLILLFVPFFFTILTAFDKMYHIRGLSHHFAIFMLFLLLLNNESKVKIFKNVSNIFFILGIASFTFYLVEFLIGGGDYVYKRNIGWVFQLSGIFSGSGANDSIGLYMVTFPFILMKFEKNKIFFYLLILTSFLIVIQTQTRMAWLGMPVVTLFYFILNRKININYFFIFPIIFFITATYIVGPNIDMLIDRLTIDLSDNKTTVSFRFYMWGSIITAVLNQPLFLGLGIYWSKLTIRTIAHNIFFEMLIWGGIIALIIFIILIIYLIYVFFKYKNKIFLKEDKQIFLTSYCSLLAYFIWGMTANAWIPIGFLLFLLNLLVIQNVLFYNDE